jgi:hypothetical protein
LAVLEVARRAVEAAKMIDDVVLVEACRQITAPMINDSDS